MHPDSILLQMTRIRLVESSLEDRRRIYQTLRPRPQVSVDEERTSRLSGLFSPDVCLLDVLEAPLASLTPRPQVPDETSVVVSLDNSR